MESYHKRETHLFSVKGVRFLLEVRTLRVYEIDDLTESILSLPEPLTWTGVEKSLAGIYDRTELKKAFSALVEEGVLLNGDEDCIEYRNAYASQGRDLPLTSGVSQSVLERLQSGELMARMVKDTQVTVGILKT